MAEVKRRKHPTRATQYGRMCELIKFLATGSKTTDDITMHLGMRKDSSTYATIRRMLNALDAAGMAQAVGYRKQKGRGLNPTLYGLTKWGMRELPVNELRCVREQDQSDGNENQGQRGLCESPVLPIVSTGVLHSRGHNGPGE